MVEILVDENLKTIVEIDDRRFYPDRIFSIATRNPEGVLTEQTYQLTGGEIREYD